MKDKKSKVSWLDVATDWMLLFFLSMILFAAIIMAATPELTATGYTEGVIIFGIFAATGSFVALVWWMNKMFWSKK